jgi:16S rRNA (guanine(527)-N(7))-methyltransferase RsmG
VFHVKHASAPGAILEPQIEGRLRNFMALLLQWNRRINLIARRDEPHIWERHVLDSLQLAPLLPASSGRLIDLGSGGGFPGLVLALITGWHVDLVESDARKGAFLREAARTVGANVTVHVARAESLPLAPAAAVTARALAPLPSLLRLAAPLLARDGVAIFPKGGTVMDELTAARREWHMLVERFPSRTSPTATLLRLREIRRVNSTG